MAYNDKAKSELTVQFGKQTYSAKDVLSTAQLQLFDRAVGAKTCQNIFRPCFNIIEGPPNKKFCCDVCKAEFRRKIKERVKQEKISLRRKKLKKEFWKFNKEHPEIYKAILKWAIEDFRNGAKRICSMQLIERARNSYDVSMDNSWAPLVGRDLIKRETDLKDVIELRKGKYFG